MKYGKLSGKGHQLFVSCRMKYVPVCILNLEIRANSHFSWKCELAAISSQSFNMANPALLSYIGLSQRPSEIGTHDEEQRCTP